jgi:transcriptional regulator with XRE-family HTH domain
VTQSPGEPGPLRLAEVRKRVGQSQAEVANFMRTTQSGVSRLERQGDLRISTLRGYAAALGGRLRLTIECGDRSFDLAVEGVDEHDAEDRRSFRVIWQDADSRALVHVGWLEYTGSGFEFSYTDEARRHERFAPFPAFPMLDESYRSAELFPYFAVRLISAADPNYKAVLDAIGLSGRNAAPAELLALGPDPQHDTIQVVPEPTEAADGTVLRTFLVSGFRYADDLTEGTASRVVTQLDRGAQLELMPEPTNPQNPRAIQLAARGTPVGWLPDYLIEEVHAYLTAGRSVEVAVERANGPDAPSHVRLQCRLMVGPGAVHR